MTDLNHWQNLAARPRVGYFIIALLAFGLLASRAQPLQPEVLFSFARTNGAWPSGGLTLGSDGNFYGTTEFGGDLSLNGGSGNGTAFRVTTNGTLTTLVSFAGTNGANPVAGLTLGTDGSFYGTTAYGGDFPNGTVFQVTTNGTLTTLVSFAGPNGANPQAGLTLGTDGNFYGTTLFGGGYGTVFQVTTNGTLTTLVSFDGTNGRAPLGSLTLGSDGNFYGTTQVGGDLSLNFNQGYGTVFQVTTNGTLTTLVSFDYTNGASPSAGLTLGPDGNFYGTTHDGGSSGYGTVFQVTTNGTLTTLVSFDYTNGFSPSTGLTLGDDGNFYSTAAGGSGGWATVFQVTTNGTLSTLVSFASTNGAPSGSLTLGSDGSFYCTTADGGSDGLGTVFRLSPREPLVVSQPQPVNQVVPAGVNVTINASAFGALPLSYQWTFNSTNLPGATNASLRLNNVSFSASGTYALLVTNSLGKASSSNAVLAVLPAIATTLPVSEISATGAVLNGSVTLGPNDTLAWFEWGTDTNYGSIAGVTDIPGGSGTVPVSNALSGVDGDLTYHYRAVGSNNVGIAYGTDQSFQVGLIPTAVTLSATAVTTNSVALNATVNPGGRHTTVWFRWGTSFNYTNLTPATSVGSGSASLNFSNVIAGLSWNTPYGCYLVASNSLGMVPGGPATFMFGKPLAFTEPATAVTGTNAWLNGLVTPNLLATTAWFEWGTNAGYGNVTPAIDVGNGSVAAAVSNLLSGLSADTTYYYCRFVSSNSSGVAVGAPIVLGQRPLFSYSAYGQSVMADTPLVYYRFEETNGTLAIDSASISGHSGVYTNVSLGNPSLVPAFGFAAGFNNSNSAVAVPALGLYNQFTLETWVKPRSFGLWGPGAPYHDQKNVIYATDNGAVGIAFLNNGPTLHQLQVSIGGTLIGGFGNSGLFPSNSWVHLAVTKGSPLVITYVNGYPLATNNAYALVNLTAAHISPAYQECFDGGIDEFAIYGTALTADRIQAHYQAAIGDPVLLSARTTNKLTFFWTGPGFKLQRNPDLSNAAGWTNVVGGSNSPVSVTISNAGNQFFRLSWP